MLNHADFDQSDKNVKILNKDKIGESWNNSRIDRIRELLRGQTFSVDGIGYGLRDDSD
jgi:hypothetical protein